MALAVGFCAPAPLLVGCGGGAKAQAGDERAKPDRIATAKKLLADAKVAEKDGNVGVAAKKYARAFRLRPNHFDTVKSYIDFLIRSSKPDEAVDIATEFSSRAIDDFKRLHLLADAKMAAGDLLGAYDTLTQLIEFDDGDALAYEKRGRVQIQRKNMAEAITDLRAAVERDKENPDYHVSLGSALHQAGELNQAGISFRGALRLDERHARGHLLFGLLLRDQQEYTDALEHHEKAAEYAPDDSRVFFELGVTQNYNGLNEKAELSLARAVKLDPDDAWNWYAYGEILRNLKRDKDAIPAYRQAIELDPDHPKAANKLGVVLYNAGDYEEAEVVLTEQIKRKPDDPYPYFNLGLVYTKTEKYGLALGALEKFVELAPAEDGDVPTAKSQIRKLKRKLRSSRGG